jgi:FkbM family methyltransferase
LKNQFLQQLRIRKYHTQVFAQLGFSMLDRFKLAWLGWRRIDACKNSKAADADQWCARLSIINGKRVHLCPDDVCHIGIFEEVIVHRSYELNLLSFEPEIILDVGAHIGLFSLAAAARWPNALVMAFEPHPENAVWARRNFDDNRVRGCVIEAVAGIEPGWVNFDASGGMGQLSSGEKSISVLAVDLKSFVSAFRASRMLLKMDIEGGEMEVLPEILPLLPRNNAVFVEIHGSLPECEKIIQIISSNGFRIRTLSNRRSEDGDQCYMDLFLHPEGTSTH